MGNSYGHNSTIRIKERACVRCNKITKIFSKGRCQACSIIESTLARMEKESVKEIESEAGLPELIAEADILFSRYLRMRDADGNGILSCYICDKKVKWQEAHLMHYISRGSSFLRFDTRNCKTGCYECNVLKKGNLALYGQRLEKERDGVTEILLEESRIPYKLSRNEVISIISEYTIKLNKLKNEKANNK